LNGRAITHVRSVYKEQQTEGDRTMKAIWNGTVLAESDDIVMVEGNAYFPESSLVREHTRPSSTHSSCAWKGTASYFDVVIGSDVNKDAIWYYPDPSAKAENIKGRVAFWKGVVVK
jgi:uncharacterized protein (DUF427 family)